MVDFTNYYQFVEYLIKNKLTIATAESCTGGLIAKLITDVSGSSRVFIGGIVSYSNKMKMKWLAVKEDTLLKYGAVSSETVSEMLDGIHNETGADLAIAVSGIAGPGGGTEEKPTGTVYIGISLNDKKSVVKYVFAGSRENVRTKSANKILDMVKTAISDI